MDSKWGFPLNCTVLVYEILCQVTIIPQVIENHRVQKEVKRAPMRAAKITLYTNMVEKWILSSWKVLNKTNGKKANTWPLISMAQHWGENGTFVVILSSLYCCFCMTSQRPCWWLRTKAFSPLGTKHHFALTTNMAALSRGCKPRIVSKPI